MSYRKVALRRRALCLCGFNVLKDEIELGAEYEADFNLIVSGSLWCGGCGKLNPVELVPVKQRSGGEGYLPREIFLVAQ